MLMQCLTEVILGELVHDVHTLASRLRLPFLAVQRFLRHLDVILLGEPTECFAVVQLLVLHNEMHRTATLSASEALAQTLGRRHIERRTLVGMKRTKPDVVHTPFLERDELRHHIHYLCSVEYTVYGWLVYHSAKLRINLPILQTKYRKYLFDNIFSITLHLNLNLRHSV